MYVFTASLSSRYDEATVTSVRTIFGGSFALVTLQTLNPPQLSQIVRLIDRAIPPRSAEAPAPAPKPVAPDDLKDEPPKEKAPPSIQLVGAFVEDRFVLVEGIKEIGKLPTLEALHANRWSIERPWVQIGAGAFYGIGRRRVVDSARFRDEQQLVELM